MLFNDIAPADDTDDQEPNYDQDVQGIVRPDIESGNQTPMQFADIQPVAAQQPQVGPIGAAVAGAAPAAAPITAAIGAGTWAAGAAAPLVAPVTEALGLAAGSIAAPWITIPAALGAGLIASGVVGKIQDWFRDNYGPTTGPLSKPYEAAAAEQQPLAYGIGRAAPIVAGMTTGAVSPLVRAASAGIMGGVDVLQQGIEKGFGNISPTEALGQAAVGAAFPVAREWAGGGARPDLATRAPQVGEEGVTPSGSTAAPVSKTSAQSGETAVGKPATPDALQEQQTQGQKSAPFNTSPSVGTAFEQPRSTTLQQVDQNTVMPAETISVVQSNRQGLKAPTQAIPSAVEGAPSTSVDTDPIPQDVAAAISPTTVEGAPVAPAPEAAGLTPGPAVAQGSTPAPAPSLPASRPSATPSLTSNSMLATPSPAMAAARNLQARKTIRNTNLDTGMMTPGMQRILGTTPPEETGLAGARVPQGPVPVEGPTPTGLEGQVPNAQQVIDNAIGAALKRPIVRQPMPSIANSSKDINGPVVIDPEIPTEYEKPLAVHETVEQTLMAKGMPYLQAHPIATQAERTVAEHMGINWDDYSTYFKDVAPRIEAQKIMPDTWDNLDLHTDPYAAIKHHTDKDIAADFRQDISEPALGQAAPAQEPVDMTTPIPDFLRATKTPPLPSEGGPPLQAMARKSMPQQIRDWGLPIPEAVLNKWDEMTDGGNGGKVPPPTSLAPNPNSPSTPPPFATQQAIDYAKSLYDKFNLMQTRLRNAFDPLRKMFRLAPTGSNEDWTAVGQAWTRKTEDQLPDNLKPLYDYYSKTIAPQQQALYEDVFKRNKKWGLLNLDNPHEGLLTRYLPRQLLSEDVVPRSDEAITGQNILGLENPLRLRDFHTAVEVDENGNVRPGAQPRLIKDNGDGEGTEWVAKTKGEGAVPTTFKYEVGEDDPGISKVGTYFSTPDGRRFMVDHADVGHIRDAGIVDPKTGQPLDYNENPVTASMASMESLIRARDTMKLLDDIKSDPKYMITKKNPNGNFTTNEDIARARWGGLYTTNLEQFKGGPGRPLYMAQGTSEALNDFKGAKIWTPNGLEQVATGLIKSMYVPGWPIHALNVAANWFIGKPWYRTEAWAGLLNDFPIAFKDVMEYGPIQKEISDAGGRTQLYGVLDEKARQEIFQNVGQQMIKDSPFWQDFAKKTGVNVPQLAQNVWNWSRKELWRSNDLLYTQQYMTFRRMGLSPEAAVNRTEQFITNYRVNNRVMGQRWLARVYKTPALSLFGGYHAGLWNSWQSVGEGLGQGIKALQGKDYDPEQLKQAMSATIAMGVLGMFVKPFLFDPLAQAVTGNPNAEFGPRGMLTIPSQLSKIATGQQGYESAVPNVFTPSLPISGMMGAIRNLDWTGQPLVPRNNLTRPGNAVRAGLQAVDAAGRVLVPPYSSLASDLAEKGTNPLRVAGKMVTQNLGIKNPSGASTNYMANIQKNNARIQKEHRAGPLERVYNKLTGGV